MSSHWAASSADGLELLPHIGEILALHASELTAGLCGVFEATSCFHEHLFTSEELLQMSRKDTEALIQAFREKHMYSQPEAVKAQGSEFAQRGLGDRCLADTMIAWQELCLPLVICARGDTKRREQILIVTAKALSGYASLFTEGFIQATRDRILDAQDKMIVALEQSLRESEQWLATTLKSIGDSVIATDTEGLITLMNPVAEQLTGWKEEDAKGMPLAEIFHIINEETRKRCENPFEKILKTGRIVGLANHTVLISKDGAERLIADSGAPIRDEKGDILGTVLVFRDISEQRKMEEDIIRLRTERMESISILAGGIAHDFNNILTAILGSVNLAKMHAVDSLVKEKLVKIEKASMQAKDLTQQLLTFSKGGAPIKKVTSLVGLIKDSTTFALRGSKVKCQFSIPKTLWPAEVDEGQIGQMISNLIINADQAMPEGGTVQVQAENVVISSDCEVPLDPGRYIQISFEDQGIGISKQYLTKIFDPYFTTKQEGSGLGLATSYSIIKNHGGCITVESHVGTGTTFHVYLPASAKQLKTGKEEKDTPVGGKGRILLMDDEESILEVTGEVLTYLGYDVEVARDGLEALELYKKAQTLKIPFDAVIIDLTIRGKMGGRETIQHLLKIDPSARAIVSSGYSDDPVMANYRDYGFKCVVSKPYTIKELSEALREVLE